MTEILKELSKKTLADYTDKAANDMIKSDQAGKKSKADKRFNGLIKAGDKINAKTRSGIKEDHKMKTLKEIFQLDELSKNTLKSYIKKAKGSLDKATKKRDSATKGVLPHLLPVTSMSDKDKSDHKSASKTMVNRSNGITLAGKKMTKSKFRPAKVMASEETN